MTVYTISHLTKIYADRKVLDIPLLEIEKGIIYALLGPNGAGKTTLLNILAFLELPTAGKIDYLSKPVEFNTPYLQKLRREVVMVDQYPILFSTSVQKNLEFGLKVRKVPFAKRATIVDEALDLVGMRDFAQAPAHRLSGGETQRIAMARALVIEPAVFLCDEPTSSVDVEHQGVILNILKQINDQKHITILFTTHDQTQAAQLATHTLFLQQGQLGFAPRENIFPAVLRPLQEDHMGCILQDCLHLSLPSEAITTKSGKVRVYIDPAKIILLDPEDNPPTTNVCQGKVVQLVEANGMVRVVIEIGIRLTLLLSEETYRRNLPLIGRTVRVAFPPASLKVLS